ncbi:MAG: hypothetical protein V1913_05645 [Fibrobacterota bacterium]
MVRYLFYPLFLLLLCLGCSRQSPVGPDTQSGGLAPILLFKTAAGMATVTFPPEIKPYARQVQFVVVKGSITVRDTMVPYNARVATVGRIPEGLVDVTVRILDSLGFSLFSGTLGNVLIQLNTTSRPTVTLHAAPLLGVPLLSLQQTGLDSVKLVMRPASLLFNQIFMTVFKQNGALWDSIGTWYYSASAYTRNAATNQFTFYDNDISYLATGGTYKYRVYTCLDTASLAHIFSAYSAEQTITLGTGGGNLTFSGSIYGSATVLTHILLFSGTGAPSDPPPATTPNYRWDMDTATGSNSFNISNIATGSYYVYAYDGFFTASDDWGRALKKTSFTLSVTRDILDTAINMDFCPGIATSPSTVFGRITGAPVGSKVFVELYWYSGFLNSTRYIGNALARDGGILGAYALLNVPSLDDFAYYYGTTSDITDTYYLGFWADENDNGTVDSGEKYYWNTVRNDAYYVLGDVTANVNVGNTLLNQTMP